MNDIGLLGLGVMGQSLALNIEDKGFSVSVFNWTPEQTEAFMKNRITSQNITPYYNIKDFVQSLKRPRKVFIMIKSGKPVDNMIQELLPYLQKGDLIIDGGNSYFKDTSRRIEELKQKGILYIGTGVSGGEEGALHGPSLMPGGSKEAYDLIKDILLKIAARTEEGPCCIYAGNDSAGHFVKMLHNGIEYAIMQCISETYDIMRKVLKLSSEEIGEIFEKWNNGELNSFLMEISYKIMKHKDDITNRPIVEIILDKAGQKGTGKWTAETSLDLGIPAPSLSAAVEARGLSFFKEQRVELSKKVSKDYPKTLVDKKKIADALEQSLLFSDFLIFSQGIWLISEASKVYNYDIDILGILKIWKGGCIIRSRMLDFISQIIKRNKDNVNLLDDEKSLLFLSDKLNPVKYVTSIAKDYYIPTPVYDACLNYYFSLTEENLPANLIQAQRDFFGAHTYSRIDREGIFHTDWE